MPLPSPGARLRALLTHHHPVVAPGAADALTALLIQQAGFPCVHCSGGGISRSLGLPDLGATTLTELTHRVAEMTEICDLPMLVDADCGFGNALNLRRTVRLLHRAGAAGLHIEDEEVPARTRAPAGNIIPSDAMTARLQAALDARPDPDFLIIARTNVLPRLGLDAAIERARIYAEAGADLVYVEFMRTRDEIEAVAARVTAPKMISQNKGATELLPPAVLGELGYRLIIHPADTQLASIRAIQAVLDVLRQQGTTADFHAMSSFAERDSIVDTDRQRSLAARFLPE